MKKFRILSQLFFVVIFFYIFFNTLIDNANFSNEFVLKGKLDFIFSVDPLIGLITLLNTHSISSIFIIAFILIFLTLIFGRFFCGFICPLGTILHFFSFLAQKMKFYNKNCFVTSPYLSLKYYILFFITILAIFQINISGYLDPLSILVKVCALFLVPFIQYLYGLNLFPSFIMDFVFNNITGREVVYYESAWIFGTIFFIIVLLNVVRSRFWCRYLCPLGALWGVMGNFSFFKVRGNENCTNCGRCNESCYACAIDGNNNAMPSECMLLFNCKDVCSNKAISYSYGISKGKIALTKRNFLKTVTYGFCVSIIFKMTGGFPEKNEKLIRPPGALSENDFLKTCVRCGACMKVCPQNFLTPSIFEGNLLDLFTPVGNAAYGYCVYNCNLCGKACPTGAIKALTVQDKNRFVIGTAFIDKNRCLPHAFNTNCAVCEEHCPTSPKAIIFNSEKTRDSDGKEILINKPVVDARRCIGCGICQYKCPVTDRPAIYITAIKNGGVINSSIREYHEER